jgi:type I restriction-modification system DNA methylase subunit
MKSITSKMRENANNFTMRWRGTTSERAESQTFINEFFEIFGLHRKDFAQFEKPIRKKSEQGVGFADLFWSGKLIIEAKSSIKDSEKDWANTLKQAEEYIDNLLPYQKPQYILLINFKRFRKYTVEKQTDPKKVKTIFNKEIELENLGKELDEFLFFPEFANQLEDAEEKINQEAARLIANVYDAIERKGYKQEDIAVFLARLMFCMFAEDTGIFETNQFENFLRNNTTTKNLGEKLKSFFEVLNTPPNKRKELEVALMKFPYVNGGLFKDNIDKLPIINLAFRETLIKCCEYDWSFISPVIFGSLFQAVIHEEERRTLGAHYTSEKNIMRVVRPLFLDELRQDFESVKNNRNQLDKFRKKLSELRFLDPACGCGNFLVVTYRELRLLDIEIIRLQNNKNLVLDVSILSNVQLTNFYGYEIDNTSAMIAEVAMWLTEHQMNMRLENEFGKTIPTIPLKEAANIKRCNSLNIDWTTNIEGKYFDYILGNPPFVGHQWRTESQMKDMELVFSDAKRAGRLDYVAAWYIKASKLIQNTITKVAFVSTNSIAQGEQAGILWNELFRYKIKIHFAHRTFKWSNEAKEIAGVHVVIIGFANFDIPEKVLYEYEDIKKEPNVLKVKNINPYLTEGKDITIDSRNDPIHSYPPLFKGSQPTDGGNLILSKEEKETLIKADSTIEKWILPFIGGEEFINGSMRFCLWLKDCPPDILRKNQFIKERLEAVSKARLKSSTPSVQNFAKFPYLFTQDRQPDTQYLAIPEVSSERRIYIPIGFLSPDIICSNKLQIIPNANLFLFGVMTSIMHMVWTKYVSGRLESRISYSPSVYNNYPFPKDVTEKKKENLEIAAQTILDVRKVYTDKGNSLADLYDPLSMPLELLKAHENLDKLVDKCYRDAPFTSESKRLEFLFELYEKYTANLFTVDKKKKK